MNTTRQVITDSGFSLDLDTNENFPYYRTFQRNHLRLIANVLVKHLRGLWQLSVSLLLNLQRSIQIISIIRTTSHDCRCSHLPALQDSQQQPWDPTMERLAGQLSLNVVYV
jgi:hypothetical protein